jgi:hypothetical protein
MPADLQDLQQRAATLRAEAGALATAYQRATWLRFIMVFFPVPFVVVLLRLEIESWTYVLFGGAYLGFSALLYVWDTRASDRCDKAERAAEAAEQAACVSRA